MFPQTYMVKIRRAIESLYDGKCTITEHQKIQKENKSTGFKDAVVLKDQPCRLSFQTISHTRPNESAASLNQTTKLFLAPEIIVKPGSKLTVTQNGKTTDYTSSGEPAVYSTHQEIILDLFKGWA